MSPTAPFFVIRDVNGTQVYKDGTLSQETKSKLVYFWENLDDLAAIEEIGEGSFGITQHLVGSRNFVWEDLCQICGHTMKADGSFMVLIRRSDRGTELEWKKGEGIIKTDPTRLIYYV